MKTTTSSPAPELVSMRVLQQMLGIRSRQTIYNKIRSDPAFPKPRRTGAYSVAWVRREVMAYINSLPTAELDGFDAIERRRTVGVSGPHRREAQGLEALAGGSRQPTIVREAAA